jgi:hypothetical protein
LPADAQAGALLVFELDHGFILLRPFKIAHKGIFARSPAIKGIGTMTLMSIAPECGGAA